MMSQMMLVNMMLLHFRLCNDVTDDASEYDVAALSSSAAAVGDRWYGR